MVIFYVSGHGYGHAVRVASVLRALRRQRPNLQISVRTQAPPSLFPAGVNVHAVKIDSGAIESEDSLRIDAGRTAEEVRRFCREEEDVVRREAAFVRDSGASLLVGDVPWILGRISQSTGVHSIALGNFSWDWIYEPILGSGNEDLQRMREAYSQIQTVLRLPLRQPAGWDMFRNIVDVPLVSRCPIAGRRLDPLPTVFLAGRAPLPSTALERGILSCEDFYFVTIGESPKLFRNWQTVRLGGEWEFPDLLAACDIVLSKLGYSLAADCIAFGKRLVYPPRTGFREDGMMQAEIVRHIPAMPIAVDEYLAGEWGGALRAVCEMPPVESALQTSGAEVCARHLLSELQ